MALFDQVKDRDADIKSVVGIPMKILRVGTRRVETVYGISTAVDIFIETGDGEKYLSGFSKGIARQIQQASPRDFPCWARIEEKELPRGTTTVLVPCEEGDSSQLTIPEEGSSAVEDDDLPF